MRMILKFSLHLRIASARVIVITSSSYVQCALWQENTPTHRVKFGPCAYDNRLQKIMSFFKRKTQKADVISIRSTRSFIISGRPCRSFQVLRVQFFVPFIEGTTGCSLAFKIIQLSKFDFFKWDSHKWFYVPFSIGIHCIKKGGRTRPPVVLSCN